MCGDLFMFDTVKSYTLWTWHGEVLDKPTMSQGTNYVDEWMSHHLYDSLKSDLDEELYPRCTNFTIVDNFEIV